VAWLDADDEYLPDALERQLGVLDARPDVALVHGAFEVVDEAGRPLPSWPAPFARDTVEPSAAALRHLIAANELATSTVVVRRSAHDAAGPFTTDVGPSSTDWEMWLRLARRGAVAYTAERIARYRQHAHTVSRATTRSGERLRCDVRVVARVVRDATPPLADAAAIAAVADAALAAKALLHAGDAFTRGARDEALDAVALAAGLAPGAAVRELAVATRAGDDLGCLRLTRIALDGLADRLDGTRFGARVRAIAAADPAWDAELAAAGDAVAGATPPDAVVAAIAKWDPALLAASGRAGCNFPDRGLLPDGYPRDGRGAVEHLEALRASHGVTHLVIPATAGWWLDHYPELAARLGAPVHRDAACAIFGLGATG
jgi:hypothetical protein